MLYIIIFFLLLLIYLRSLFHISLVVHSNVMDFEPSLVSMIIINNINIRFSFDRDFN
jgi:hypothetical protein